MIVDTDGLTGGGAPLDGGGDGTGSTLEGGADAPSEASEASTDVCPAGALDPDLVVWLPMNETAGDVLVDCARKGHDARPVSSTGWSRTTGRTGGGIDLDGATGCFDLGVASDLAFTTTPFTVAAWIKGRTFADPSGDSVTVVGRNGDLVAGNQPSGWKLGTDTPPATEFDVTPLSGGSVESQNAIAADRFVHIAGVLRPGGSPALELYVDGVRVGTRSSLTELSVTPGAHASVGCDVHNGLYFFGGVIDDVRVYKRALSATELADLAR